MIVYKMIPKSNCQKFILVFIQTSLTTLKDSLTSMQVPQAGHSHPLQPGHPSPYFRFPEALKCLAATQ